MKALWLAAALWTGHSSALSGNLPTIRYDNGKLVGYPAIHHRAGRKKWEVIENEACPARGSVGPLPVPERCDFLRGVFRYEFQEAGENEPSSMLTEFLITRRGKSHTLLVGAPIAARASAR